MITKGTGWTQERGQPRQVIRAGDVVWCLPGIEHGHGATDTTAVMHIALQAVEDGSAVTWSARVTGEGYGG